MEVVLSMVLPDELVEKIMKMVHLLNLQENHKSLAKVKFGFIFNNFSNYTVFTYAKNGRHIFINGILNGYQEKPLYGKLIFMHNYKYISSFSH